MDLLERYLQAIRWWLPSGADRDLVTELADDLRSQVEEKEVELGRKLQEDELVAILKRCGHPMTVAGRLLPGKSFLSPALSVVYGFVLRIVLLGVLPAALVLTILPALLTSHDPVGAVLGRLGATVQAAFYAAAIITLIFFLVDRHQGRLGVTHEWDPRRLPRVRDARRIPRSESAAGIVVGALFLAWWNGVASGPFHLGRFGEVHVWSEFFESFRESLYWPVLVLTLAGMALSGVALFRPYWTRARLALRTAIDGTLALALTLSLRRHGGDLAELIAKLSAGRHALKAAEAEPEVLRLVVIGSVLVTAVAVGLATVVDLARLLNWRDAPLEAPARRS